MPKKGMKRPDVTHIKQKNELPPVPEIQGKAKSGNKKANPLMETGEEFSGKVYHGKGAEKKISSAYSVIDTDLGRDNVENDLPTAEFEDL